MKKGGTEGGCREGGESQASCSLSAHKTLCTSLVSHLSSAFFGGSLHPWTHLNLEGPSARAQEALPWVFPFIPPIWQGQSSSG